MRKKKKTLFLYIKRSSGLIASINEYAMILFDLTVHVQMHMCITYLKLNLPLANFGLPVFKFK